MRRGSLRPSGRRPKTTLVAWGLASILFLFTVENIWIDPWLRNKSHKTLSMVPEALSGSWFRALMVGGIMLAFLVMCQILLAKDRSLSVWTKVGKRCYAKDIYAAQTVPSGSPWICEHRSRVVH